MSNLIFKAVMTILGASKAISKMSCPVKYDAGLGNDDVVSARAGLAKGQYDAAEALVKQCRNADDRSMCIEVLMPESGRPAWVDAWVKDRPESALALCVAGGSALKWAWEARGGAAAKYVDGKRWDPFFERLKQGEELLRRSVQLESRDPTPWALLIKAAIGLQQGTKEGERLLSECNRRSPGHVLAHDTLLHLKCEKWGGEPGEMREFMFNSTANLPAGHPLLSLVPACVFQEWIVAGMPGSADGQQFFSDPSRLSWVSDASTRLLSTNRPRLRGEAQYQGFFAAYFWHIGMHDRAKPHLQLMGNHAARIPWMYFLNPYSALSKAHKAAGL
jgi:hypothetical protein